MVLYNNINLKVFHIHKIQPIIKWQQKKLNMAYFLKLKKKRLVVAFHTTEQSTNHSPIYIYKRVKHI